MKSRTPDYIFADILWKKCKEKNYTIRACHIATLLDIKDPAKI